MLKLIVGTCLLGNCNLSGFDCQSFVGNWGQIVAFNLGRIVAFWKWDELSLGTNCRFLEFGTNCRLGRIVAFWTNCRFLDCELLLIVAFWNWDELSLFGVWDELSLLSLFGVWDELSLFGVWDELSLFGVWDELSLGTNRRFTPRTVFDFLLFCVSEVKTKSANSLIEPSKNFSCAPTTNSSSGSLPSSSSVWGGRGGKERVTPRSGTISAPILREWDTNSSPSLDHKRKGSTLLSHSSPSGGSHSHHQHSGGASQTRGAKSQACPAAT